MARPKAVEAGVIRSGVPACSRNALRIAGTASIARTMANAIRWVNVTLLPPVFRWWRLMRRRFSESSLTGISRTDVAVGMVRLASMFSTIRAPTPLIALDSAPSGSEISGASSRAGSAAPSPDAPLDAEAIGFGAGAEEADGSLDAAEPGGVGAPSPCALTAARGWSSGRIIRTLPSVSDASAPRDVA